MKRLNIVLEKAILVVVSMALSSCATWVMPSPTIYGLPEPVSEGETIDVDDFSVKAPRGEGWEVSIYKDLGNVIFTRGKKALGGEALGAGMGALGTRGRTRINTFRVAISPEDWRRNEVELADNYRNLLEQRMVQEGAKTGEYKLEDVKKETTSIDGRKLYLMSYKLAPVTDPEGRESILYLYFPQNFKKSRAFYAFRIDEFFEKSLPAKPDPTQIYPVISSFQVTDHFASLTGTKGEFIRAAATGDITAVNDLLDKGVEVNMVRPEGTALSLASFYGHTKVVNLLMDRGADVKKTGKGGFTALMGAILGDETEIAKLLIEKGSAINAQSDAGNTPLIFATEAGNTEIARLLIEKGVDVNHKNNVGVTPLISASINGRDEIVKLLVQKGADINAQQDDGWTALIRALDRAHTETAKLLVEKGADVNLKGKNGGTALMAAVFEGPVEMVKLLIEKGADVNAKMGNQTALKLAKSRGQQEMIDLLKKAGAKE